MYVPVSIRKANLQPSTTTPLENPTGAYTPVSERLDRLEIQPQPSVPKRTSGYVPVSERRARPDLSNLARPTLVSDDLLKTSGSAYYQSLRKTKPTVKNVTRGTLNLISGLNPFDKVVREGVVEGMPVAVSGLQRGLSRVVGAAGEKLDSDYLRAAGRGYGEFSDENYELGKLLNEAKQTEGITPFFSNPDFAQRFTEDPDFAKRMIDKYATEDEKNGVQPTQQFLELIQDPTIAKKMVAKNLPNLFIGAGTGIATTVATGGNVPAGLAAAFSVTGLMEGGNAINEAQDFLENHPEEAYRDLAKDDEFLNSVGIATGVINGAIEILPIGNLLNRLPNARGVKRKIVQKVLNQYLRGALTQSALEGSTEAVQETVNNAVAQLYDEERELFEGITEAGIIGAITGGGVSVATDVTTDTLNAGQSIQEYYNSLSPAEKQAGFFNLFGGEPSNFSVYRRSDSRKVVPDVVVQVVNRQTGEKVYYTMSERDFKAIDAAIDSGQTAIAGDSLNDGRIFHLTAKTPQDMRERGFKPKGRITPAQINAIKRKNGLPTSVVADKRTSPRDVNLDRELDDQEKRIIETVTAQEVEDLLKRTYPRLGEFYDSFEQWLEQDADTLELEIENQDVNLQRRSERLRERAELPAEDGTTGFRGDVSLSEILELYKEGRLENTPSVATPQRQDITIEDGVEPTLRTPFSPEPIKSLTTQELKLLYERAGQRINNKNRAVTEAARRDLFIQYNANRNLAQEIGVTPAELNKKIRQFAGFPSRAVEVQRNLNEGTPREYSWIGISNSSYITKQGVDPNVVDKLVAEVIDDTENQSYYGADGDMLRQYIVRTMLAIDTRIDFSDLTFEINALERALGQYNNREVKITIDNGYQNTVAHEIGHYLDYKWARELGFTSDNLTGITQAGFNEALIKERYGISDEHMQWVQNFKDFTFRLMDSGDLGSSARKAEYLQTPTETFARFVDKFAQWTNKQAGVREWSEDQFYKDKFTEAQFREFVKILQEKAFIDAKYNVQYNPKGEEDTQSTPISGVDTKKALKEEDSQVNQELDPAIFERPFTELTPEEKQAILEREDNTGLSEELEQRALQLAFKREAVESNPAKNLSKYAGKNGLPEVTGEKGKSEFARRGDQIVTGLGYDNTEQAREEWQKYKQQRDSLRAERRQFFIDKRQYIDKRNIDNEIATQIRKRIRDEKRGAKQEGKRIRARQREVKAYINALNLSNAERKKIQGARSIDLMTEEKYEEFLDNLEREAQKLNEQSKARAEVNFTIFDKGLTKVENLQRALRLPTINNMTTQQLRDFDELLQQYKDGDEFLTQRKIEMVDRTDLKGIRTLREARERLAEELDVPVDSLGNIKVGELDRLRYDTDLARQNPFYGMIVENWHRVYLTAEATYLQQEREINELIKKARKSRKRSIGDRLVPTDERIFDYMEANDEKKKELAKDMTPEELAVTDQMIKNYETMRDYLIQHEVLKKYRSDYITHIRRGFLETWKEDGILRAFKEIFEAHEMDQANFNILDSQTGDVLALEKFFQFSMRRTGGIKPTKNVARAYLTYLKSFEKKRMLDAIVPKIDIYAHSLTPSKTTPKGLVFDRSLKRFINEYLNNKKGRTVKLVAQQGGKIDWAMRGIKMFTSVLDLGFSIPIGIASQFGEQVSNYIGLGSKAYALGAQRILTKQGRKITEKYQNFTGRTPWDEITDPSLNIGDRFLLGMFSLFRDATVRANKIYLLGSLTTEEFKSGEVSSDRLALMRANAGKFRVLDESKSIIGSTAEGGLATQYKTWAIPHLTTSYYNVKQLAQGIREGRFDVNSKEFHELLRGIVVIGMIGLILGAWIDEDDDSFTGEILYKAYRDAMTSLGSLNPKVALSVPRVLTFLEDIGTALEQILFLEKYKSGEKEGTLKGDNKLYQTFTPSLVRQIDSVLSDGDDGGGATGGLPALPALPTLPVLPDLPALPALPSI